MTRAIGLRLKPNRPVHALHERPCLPALSTLITSYNNAQRAQCQDFMMTGQKGITSQAEDIARIVMCARHEVGKAPQPQGIAVTGPW